ncbi:MAG: 2-hydroxyglutaryl-CoA dehydratase [Clostridiales bacterium]|nr:2-hydroxyglutaryl-CoA dehydratase [Clostridiales bacterium]
MEHNCNNCGSCETGFDPVERVEFTKEMKKDYTILIPNMLEIQFLLLRNVFRSYGYKMELLTNDSRAVVETGLKYVHNDTCYPALLVIGQMIDALKSGKYDLSKTALMITQTGGGCRASNYIHLLRKALKKADLGYIPVISLNLSGLEKNSGFHWTLGLIRKLVAAMAYGDMMMLLANQVRPYETVKGAADKVTTQWVNQLTDEFAAGRGFAKRVMRSYMEKIAADYAAVPVDRSVERVKVGIVGEIYVKFAALANNHLEEFLASEGCEVMVPGLMSFILFKTDNRIEDVKLYGGSGLKKGIATVLFNYLSGMEEFIIDIINEQGVFKAPTSYAHLKKLVDGIVGYGSKMGEGWLLTAEMLELIENGYGNIVCAQPFGCLPNHIVGKGMIRRLRELHPEANIVPIDYDPGATRVNQENRIKLMLSVAREQLASKQPTKADSTQNSYKREPAKV